MNGAQPSLFSALHYSVSKCPMWSPASHPPSSLGTRSSWMCSRSLLPQAHLKQEIFVQAPVAKCNDCAVLRRYANIANQFLPPWHWCCGHRRSRLSSGSPGVAAASAWATGALRRTKPPATDPYTGVSDKSLHSPPVLDRVFLGKAPQSAEPRRPESLWRNGGVRNPCPKDR